jgi:hypothetical protein
MQQQLKDQAEVIKRLEQRVRELECNLDEEIKGYAAAAKFIGVSVSTLEKLVRRCLISYKKEGKAVSFSRKDLVAYKSDRRIKPIRAHISAEQEINHNC